MGEIIRSFHFLPALENGDFQDFAIQSRSGREFPVHKTILRAQKINIDERFLKSVFDGFSDDVTQTLLHFIYSQSLPDNLSIFTANQVIGMDEFEVTLRIFFQLRLRYKFQ